MSLPDAPAAAAMDGTVIKPVWFVYLDVLGDPLRANTSGVDVGISGSGQQDLDGTYIGVDASIVEISSVKSKPGGSGPMTISLSGLPGIDQDVRDTLAVKANWQGRPARLWRMIRDSNDVQQGGIQHYYTGYMMGLTHVGSTSELKLNLSIESYLAAFSEASNRTFLGQEDFDPGDLSGRAAIAIANGNMKSRITNGAGGLPRNHRGGFDGGGIGSFHLY